MPGIQVEVIGIYPESVDSRGTSALSFDKKEMNNFARPD
jgi:hypothetical protein